MGGAQSQNTLNNIIDNIIKKTTDLSQIDETNITQGQVLDVVSKGDINIGEISMSQDSYVNLSAVSGLMNTLDMQSDISNQLSQLAESMTKGINLGNFSSSENDLSSLIESTMQSIDDFAQNCIVNSAQSQQIRLKADGNVTVKAIQMSQLQNTLQKCMSTIADNNKLQNKIDNIVGQTATAKTIGIDPTAILVAIIVIIGMIIVGIELILKDLIPYLLPIIGIVLIYFGVKLVLKSRETKGAKINAKWYGFTSGLDKTEFCSKELFVADTKPNLSKDEAEKMFSDNEKYTAMDWTLDKTTFYNGTISKECINALSKVNNKSDVAVNKIEPKFFAGDINPSDNMGQEGYVFINTKDGTVMRRRKIGWRKIMDLQTVNFSVICDPTSNNICMCEKDCLGDEYKIKSEPIPDRDNYIAIKSIYNFMKFKKQDGKWAWNKNIDGTGYLLTAKTPEEMDKSSIWTCVKSADGADENETMNKIVVITGPVLIGIGLIFVIAGVVMAMSSRNKNIPPVQKVAPKESFF